MTGKFIIPALAAAVLTLCSCRNESNRVVILLTESDCATMAADGETFISSTVPFALERTVRKDDTDEMKELLVHFVWKNNELNDKIRIPDGIRPVKVAPGKAADVLAEAIAAGWEVKTPSVWRRIRKEENRKDSFKTYYVAAAGNDANDGLSPESPWATLDKVNDADLGFGDSVLFKSGDVFRGQLQPMSGRPGAPIVYASYGEGDKPVIEPSFDASGTADWEKAGENLWRCAKPSDFELANVIFDHGDNGCGWKEDKLEQLGGCDLHFCWVQDEKALYMVSEANPATRFTSIELAEKKHCIAEEQCHDVCYNGLWLRYTGAHGIGGSGVKRIEILNCDICWIGGSTLYIDETGTGVRYGNGIEFWSSAEDVKVDHCNIWECWDAGITNQSNEPGMVQKNISYTNNRIWNCEYSYEYWQQGKGARTENIVFENNTCLKAGGGWAHNRRWNPNAGHLMFYDNTATVTGFVIRGNRFEDTEDCGIRMFTCWYPSITMEGNTWIIPENNICRFHGRPTSGLTFLYPDHLDRRRVDDAAEIESQTAEQPETFGAGEEELRRFEKRFGFKDLL